MAFSTIKFLQDYTPQAVHARSYTAGEIVELSEASAQHFLSRGLAIYAAGHAAPAEAPEEIALPGEVPTRYGRLREEKEKKKQSSASRQARVSQKKTVTGSEETEEEK